MKHKRWENRILHFGFLNAQNIRLVFLDPLLHTWQPGFQRIDIPRSDQHRNKLLRDSYFFLAGALRVCAGAGRVCTGAGRFFCFFARLVGAAGVDVTTAATAAAVFFTCVTGPTMPTSMLRREAVKLDTTSETC